jgi:uncharacterized FlgJ-related protein
MNLLWVILFYFLPIKAENLELTNKNVWNTIQSAGIKHADIVFAQAILESGHFKSKLVKTNNNLFGMKLPKIRETTAIGSKNKYATYKHWMNSVQDYKMYQNYLFRKKEMSRIEYLSYIKKNYSTTPDYVTRVMKIVNRNKDYENDNTR